MSLSTPGDLPYPGIEPMSLASPASAGGFFTTCGTWEAYGAGEAQSFISDHMGSSDGVLALLGQVILPVMYITMLCIFPVGFSLRKV